MEATRSSETLVYNKPTRRHIPEDLFFLDRLLEQASYSFGVFFIIIK
jgi:hypothetical protein